MKKTPLVRAFLRALLRSTDETLCLEASVYNYNKFENNTVIIL